ncbi:hypothetical protein AMECASPLE_032812 [Ameca splendens]|uniref:Uncharacterized protein n=1 Tax=Ameca splendens TaxID=208324 RepID=A0ABV0ZRI9_9TELE
MDGAESSSESEMEVDDQSEEEMETKTPQKQERQVTPKKTAEKNDEDDEFGGSTDVDEPVYEALFSLRLSFPSSVADQLKL